MYIEWRKGLQIIVFRYIIAGSIPAGAGVSPALDSYGFAMFAHQIPIASSHSVELAGLLSHYFMRYEH